MTARETIENNVKKVFKDVCKVDLTEVSIEHPQNPLWGDYSTNIAMLKAKELAEDPLSLAEKLVDGLRNADSGGMFKKVTVANPGFINFTLSDTFLLDQIRRIISEGERYGSDNTGCGKKIALEHSNANPNKAVHLGHLRNAVIGQFLDRVYRFIGYDVNVQYYSNDLGTQAATSLLGVRKLGSISKAEDYSKFDHYAWDIYTKISKMIEADPSLKTELEDLMAKLDARDPEISNEQLMLSDRILQDNLSTFADLGIDYDLIVKESSIKDFQMWEKTFDMLKRNSNIYYAESGPSKGCWLVKMGSNHSDKHNTSTKSVEEDKIIVRSNGIPTYTGKDISYHMWKYGLLETDFTYNIVHNVQQKKVLYETAVGGSHINTFTNNDIVINVIDVKQTYAIDAVRLSMRHLGYIKQSDSLIHINYGHVYLSGNTAAKLGYKDVRKKKMLSMSGRKGIGIMVDEFTLMVEKELKTTHGDFPNFKKVRNATIKYDMLRYDTYQDVVFDIEKALNFKGNTGAYLEYTHARACAVLNKAKYKSNIKDIESEIIIEKSEESIIRKLYRFPEIVKVSAEKYAPNIMCVYLFDLCQKYNYFYNDVPIINADTDEKKDFRLMLTEATRQVLNNGLYLLGIEAVDKM